MTRTAEHTKLSRAASYGAPAASIKADKALQDELVSKGFIKYAGYGQNSMTPRYRITDAGRARLSALETSKADAAHRDELSASYDF